MCDTHMRPNIAEIIDVLEASGDKGRFEIRRDNTTRLVVCIRTCHSHYGPEIPLSNLCTAIVDPCVHTLVYVT